MALIKSISGIRGTIGGKPNETLSPLDIVRFAAAYGTWVIKQNGGNTKKIIVGRDGRISGALVQNLVVNTLNALGLNVVDVGLTTTPTVEMAVVFEKATGGIMLTASHNPKEWNALKLLNNKGEFLSAMDGAFILNLVEQNDFNFVNVDCLGAHTFEHNAIAKHISAVVNYPLVDVRAITNANFNIVADVINSTGVLALPPLFQALGVKNFTLINKELTGDFTHNPEPLPENLTALCEAVVQQKATLGIAVDPDVDRLCFVCEDGSLFGEEYTLVAVADYVLQQRNGNTVSNLSSTRALKDLTLQYKGVYTAAAVGEVNVVATMKAVNAVIGGEGNGGVIVPDLHYGRDALIGIALFLTHLAKQHTTPKKLRNTYPNYFMSKNKIEVSSKMNIPNIFAAIEKKYTAQQIDTQDGLKIEFETNWVQLRTSNTEPIIRIYAEAPSMEAATTLAQQLIHDIKEFADACV